MLITGTPRSGTTLTCHLLNKLPDTVALHEPMRVKAFESLGRDEIVEEIGRFCDEQRSSLRRRGRAISKNVDGVVPDNPIGEGRSEDGLRKRLVSKGEIVVDKPLSADFMLVIKHNSAFTAVLESLVGRFPVYGVIRNPLATLASWSSVEFSASSGYARAAERLDPELKARLAAIAAQASTALDAEFGGEFTRTESVTLTIVAPCWSTDSTASVASNTSVPDSTTGLPSAPGGPVISTV